MWPAKCSARIFELPLLIGGATTSPAHTAVKIEPNYEGPVIYVKDASRSVGVAQALIEPGTRDALVSKARKDNERRREQHSKKKRLAPQLSIGDARSTKASMRVGKLTFRRLRHSRASACIDDIDLAGAAQLHRLDAILSMPGSFTASFRTS